MQFIVQTLVTAFALWAATRLVSGIRVPESGLALIFAAIVFGLVNALVKPLLVFLSLPITFLTLGLFLLVINALMLMLTAALVPGMQVNGFGSAFWGALVVSIVSWLVSVAFGLR
jgi:putative membrane protein